MEVNNRTESAAIEPEITAGEIDATFGDRQDAPTTAGPRRPWRQAVLADLRGAILDASLGLVLTAVSFGYIWWRIEAESSEGVLLMGPDFADPSYWPSWMVQATGWAAWWWAWGTVSLGLLVAGDRPTWLPGSTRTIEKLHRTTSLTVIGLTLAHILVLIYGRVTVLHETVTSVLAKAFVPGAFGGSSSANWGVGIGIVGFYLAIVLGLSYYLRHRIGVRTWRFAHRFSIVVYVLATWHTFVYGADTWYTGWQRTTLWVLQLPIAAMVLYRLLSPLRRSEQLPLKPGELLPRLGTTTVLRLGVRLIAAAALVVLIGIVALDRTGGHQRPDHYPTETMDHGASATTGE